jgi:hypothetical protein
MPVFMVEANYEGEHNQSDLGTPNILRRQEYWTLLRTPARIRFEIASTLGA